MTKNRGQRLDRQRMLAELGEFALQCEDLDEVLATACEIAGQALAPRRARIYEIESADDTLVVRAEVGCGDDGAAKLRLPMTARSSETCSIKLDKVIVIPDITRDTRFEVPEFMRRAGVVAFVNVPILLPRNRAFGLLQVDATEPYEFDEEDVAFLRICAMILGPVIDRLRRLSDLDSARERLDIIVGNALDYAIFLTDAEDRIIDWPPGAEARLRSGRTGPRCRRGARRAVVSPQERRLRVHQWHGQGVARPGWQGQWLHQDRAGHDSSADVAGAAAGYD